MLCLAQGLTQFGRALKELSIELICAHSPQAKGRVERANHTLQDRLTKELRLRGISTVAAANAYLPQFSTDYNSRFSVEPRSVEDAHRPLSASQDLDPILTLCERRTLSKNLTISCNHVIYQITTRRAAYAMRKAHVEVREPSGGEITIECKGKPLEYSVYREQERKPSQVTPSKMIDAALSRSTAKAPRKYGPVPMSHPWRGFDYSKKSIAAMEKRGDICTWRK